MTQFNISVLNVLPKKKELAARVQELEWYGDLFSVAPNLLSGEIELRLGDEYIRFSTDFLFLSVLNIMDYAFNIAFIGNQPTETTIDIPDTNEGLHTRGHHGLVIRQSGTSVTVRVWSSLGAVNESSRHSASGGEISFDMSIVEFTQAVWRGYSDLLSILERRLDGIDGFHERFCRLPFRSEAGPIEPADY